MPTFDDRDAAILAERQAAYDTILGARVGDWCIMPNGERLRFTYDWGDSLQTTCTKRRDFDPGPGSFYLCHQHISYSGSLDPSLPRTDLVDTGETANGRVWFFHHNQPAASNGVYTDAVFRVFRYTGPVRA